jgi:hypothetical protein
VSSTIQETHFHSLPATLGTGTPKNGLLFTSLLRVCGAAIAGKRAGLDGDDNAAMICDRSPGCCPIDVSVFQDWWAWFEEIAR